MKRECDRTVAAQLLLSLAAGAAASPAAIEWLAEGARRWICAGGALDLHRALRLPATPGRLVRDYWLSRAADVLAGEGVRDLPRALATEWAVFTSRGPWRQWRAHPEPPAEASQLRAALHRATVASGGKTLAYRQLRTVLGRFSAQTLPAVDATMLSWRLAPQPENCNGNDI